MWNFTCKISHVKFHASVEIHGFWDSHVVLRFGTLHGSRKQRGASAHSNIQGVTSMVDPRDWHFCMVDPSSGTHGRILEGHSWSNPWGALLHGRPLKWHSAWSTPRVGYPSHLSDGETILYILPYLANRVTLQELFFLRSIHCVPRQLLIVFADDIVYVRTTVRIAIRPSDVDRRPSNKSIMQPPPPPAQSRSLNAHDCSPHTKLPSVGQVSHVNYVTIAWGTNRYFGSHGEFD